jgi:hypothetical protein
VSPFLTDQDSRATVKGSRDPLGLVPVWSRFGRYVVGNLSTVSNSVRGFTTLLLGYYFAQAVHEREREQHQSTLDLFLKFEQLAGYSRWHVKQDKDFRGQERVLDRLAKGPKVTLGSDSSSQILSNQKIYGLWGLFSVPARTSGLLAKHEPILTPEARTFVEKQYIARFTADGIKAGRAIVELLRRERPDVYLDGRDAGIATSIAKILCAKPSAAERQFYDRFLVDGGDEDTTKGRQPILSDILEELPGAEFGMPELREAIKRAENRSGGQELAQRLTDIADVEALLVPMESAFFFLLTRDGQTLTAVAKEIRSAWGPGLRHLHSNAISRVRHTVAAAFHESEPAARRFEDLASALRGGDYEALLRLLLEHNRFVMQARNGSQPWVRLDGAHVDVRYRDESGHLLGRDQLRDYWRNTYFINSLRSVVRTLTPA